MTELNVSILINRAFSDWKDRCFLEFGDEVYTYGQIAERGERWCDWLRANGISKGCRVAINLRNSLDCIDCIIACARLGAVYVPIDPVVPSARKQVMLDAARVDIMVCDDDIEASELVVKRCAILPESWQGRFNPDPLEWAVDDPFAIMFTSGSTGTPKGVIFPQGGIAPLVMGKDTYLPLTCSDRVLQVSARSFDAFVWELWGALFNGACLVLLSSNWSIAELGQVLVTKRISAAFLTARLFDTLIDTIPDTMKGMRLIGFGGEAGSAQHIAKALDILPGVQLVNGYGPSENTTFSLCWTARAPIQIGSALPIGRPCFPDVAWLLDPETLDIIDGEGQGELFVGGPGLALGYTDAHLTAERFVFVPALRQRLFRTGDFVRRQEDGNFQFLGRLDRQVKILGARFNLFELEADIARHPEITWVHSEYDRLFARRELAVFYTTASGRALSDANLKAHLSEGDMKQSPAIQFYHVERVPLKVNGKADLAAIMQSIGESQNKISSNDPIEQLWVKFLPGVEINTDTDFFESGGDSLAALNLLLETEHLLGINLPGDFLIHYSRFGSFKDAVHTETAVSSPFVTLNEGEGGIVVLLLPWLDGSPYSFVHLLRHIPTHLRVISVDFRKMREMSQLSSLADIREQLLEKLLGMGIGAISLIGPSLGGVVALDLARALEEKGGGVSSVVLLDSFLPNTIVKIRLKAQAYEIFSIKFWNLRIRRRLKNSIADDTVPVVSFSFFRPKSWRKFMPRCPNSGRVFLLQAEEENDITQSDRDLAKRHWLRFVPRLIVKNIPGAHLTILDEIYCQKLADTICEIL